jgi:antitoxin FitA
MPTITLKNVPIELHSTLKERAKSHKRSLNQEAIRCLESSILPAPANADAFLSKVRKTRKSLQTAGVPTLTDAFLELAKTNGRE